MPQIRSSEQPRVRFTFVDGFNGITAKPIKVVVRLATEHRPENCGIDWTRGVHEFSGIDDLSLPMSEEKLTELKEAIKDRHEVLAFQARSGAGSRILFIRCTICKKFINWDTERVASRRNSYLCEPCYRKTAQCVKCGEITSAPKEFCDTCAKLYRRCGVCTHIIDIEHEKCEYCHPKKKPTVSAEERERLLRSMRLGIVPSIHDYSHKPRPIFYPPRPTDEAQTPLYFGVELEVDDFRSASTINEAASRLQEINNEEKLFYLKYDGTIRAGFEIVTHPCTLEYHKTSFPWETIKRICIIGGGRSHETNSCGLHVHFNNEFLGCKGTPAYDINVLKLLNITTHFWKQLVKFSRRNTDQLNNFASQFMDDFKPTISDKHKLAYLLQTGRHRAVNLHPDKTIEVRIFKGTLNNRTIIATLELLDFLVRWVKNSSVADMDVITWEKLVEQINKEENKELIEYLEKRKLLCA